MKITELLMEGATDVLYHYTKPQIAAKILDDGEFKLSRSLGSSIEHDFAPNDRPYFMSTTNSKVGDFHSNTSLSSGVVFVLDGQWFSQRYKVKPIDYWNRSWLNSFRSSESEERVFSREPSIPIDGVTAIHVFLKEKDSVRSPLIRKLLIDAKRRGIKTFLYNDIKSWRLQDTEKSIRSSEMLKGRENIRTMSKYDFNQSKYIEPWVELIFKKSKSELSPDAEKLRHDLVYYGSRDENYDGGLISALGYARKPDDPADWKVADRIIKFMRANQMKSTVDLKKWLVKKWASYNAKPLEIETKFAQVMKELSDKLNQFSKRADVDLYDAGVKEFKIIMNRAQISSMFPGGNKSVTYRSMFSRGVKFIRKFAEAKAEAKALEL